MPPLVGSRQNNPDRMPTFCNLRCFQGLSSGQPRSVVKKAHNFPHPIWQVPLRPPGHGTEQCHQRLHYQVQQRCWLHNWRPEVHRRNFNLWSHLQQTAKKTRELIAACNKACFTLNVKKIIYDKPEVVFEGYHINEKGYMIDPALSTALSEFPVPKSQMDIRSFCGLANQRCNFSDDNSEALAPFKHLLKKGQKSEWNDDLQTVFEAVRCHLTSTKTLGSTNWTGKWGSSRMHQDWTASGSCWRKRLKESGDRFRQDRHS